jgi:1,4-alpha-glucan branching enzyme
MNSGVLSVPVPAGGQVQVRLALVADRDVFEPAGWRHEDLQPTGAAGWFERDLDGLGLADGEYEYELVVDGREDAPVPDPFARAITRFYGYRGLFSVAGGVVVPDRFRWDDEFPGGMGLPQNNRLVVYEMPVRWMTGEDSSGPDGSPGIRQVGLGRFEQVRFQHLEDLARLGVNAIELMPIQDSPDTLNGFWVLI